MGRPARCWYSEPASTISCSSWLSTEATRTTQMVISAVEALQVSLRRAVALWQCCETRPLACVRAVRVAQTRYGFYVRVFSQSASALAAVALVKNPRICARLKGRPCLS